MKTKMNKEYQEDFVLEQAREKHYEDKEKVCDLCKEEDETTKEYNVDDTTEKINVCDNCYEDSLSSCY